MVAAASSSIICLTWFSNYAISGYPREVQVMAGAILVLVVLLLLLRQFLIWMGADHGKFYQAVFGIRKK